MGKTISELSVVEPSKLELITLAAELGKEIEWVDKQLLYVSRTDLHEWIGPAVDAVKDSSIGIADHLRMYERDKGIRCRFEAAKKFHGACWLTMDDLSSKRKNEDLNVLVLVEGSSSVGCLIPPKKLASARKGEEGSFRVEDPVMFRLKKMRNGTHVWFDGDDNVEVNDSPIKSLCSTLGVTIKDIRRSVSSLILRTMEEPWVPLNYRDNKFQLGIMVNKAIKDRLIGSGLPVIVDTIIRETKTG